MKGIRLLLAVLLVPLAFQAVAADDMTDASRAAVRRGATTTTNAANRLKTTKTDTRTTQNQTASRNIASPTGTVRERTNKQTDAPRSGNVIDNKSRGAISQSAPKSVVARATSNIQSRSSDAPSRVSARKNQGTAQSNALRSRTAKTSSRNALTTRTATQTRPSMVSRAATTDAAGAIAGRDFTACKKVFYDCMDEFCANKDAGLKRCACSTRINEFDNIKKQLANAEDKLLDFSQRLLTVSMDKEDALALNTATEGEIAYAQTDDSESKKLLDSISKKLNASFDDDNFNQSLNAISLSLDSASAFDDIDSMMGATTTTKSGTALYNDALPICREMALEICSESDVDIVESGYQMAIEQDCNTVAKSYASQTEQTRAKILESSALLDMSRLSKHQEQNSDDILTCKKKMLTALSEPSVCGENLTKCLDTTGKYIDPSTGEAFLTDSLADLGQLIIRPDSDHKWKTVPENEKFVSFLNSKKVYLEPAMKNCQTVADHVWDEFIEDALAQIKLAQESKLETVRQSCTTLMTQCLDTANKNISEFDARALSIFGVNADVTVNAMCADVRTACTALMNATDTNPDTPGSSDTSDTWDTGMTEIAASKSFETILKTCREVGKNCIIRECTSTSGNFGLCENINTSINRKSIINRRSCWNEVKECVSNAGDETLEQIMKNENSDNWDVLLYGPEYATSTATIDSSITNDNIYKKWSVDHLCTENDGYACRIAERIWGNCEFPPSTIKKDGDTEHNAIITNQGDNETLLSWFARNTGTENAPDSCRDTTCLGGQTYFNTTCISNNNFADSGEYCPVETDNSYKKFNIYDGTTNCCQIENLLDDTVCCQEGFVEYTDKNPHYAVPDPTQNIPVPQKLCTQDGDSRFQYVFTLPKRENSDYQLSLVCMGGDLIYSDNSITCTGAYVLVRHNDGKEPKMKVINEANALQVQTYYLPSGSVKETGTNNKTITAVQTLNQEMDNWVPYPAMTTGWSITYEYDDKIKDNQTQ